MRRERSNTRLESWLQAFTPLWLKRSFSADWMDNRLNNCKQQMWILHQVINSLSVFLQEEDECVTAAIDENYWTRLLVVTSAINVCVRCFVEL